MEAQFYVFFWLGDPKMQSLQFLSCHPQILSGLPDLLITHHPWGQGALTCVLFPASLQPFHMFLKKETLRNFSSDFFSPEVLLACHFFLSLTFPNSLHFFLTAWIPSTDLEHPVWLLISLLREVLLMQHHEFISVKSCDLWDFEWNDVIESWSYTI